MKPAILRPQAQSDRRAAVRYYRQEAGIAVASRLVVTADAALDRLERAPGIGSPRFGMMLDLPDLRVWRLNRFPLLWFYFESGDHLDVVRLLGERQDIATVLADDQ